MKSLIKKNRIFKQILITFLLIGFFIPMIAVSAAPTVDINPTKPKPEQSITITVVVTDETTDAVHFLIQECEGTSLCHQQQNITLNKENNQAYSGSFTLEYPKATYMQYTLNVHTTDGWTKYDENTKVDLDLSTSNENGDNNVEDSPGFEFIVIAFSIIFISLFMYKRKR
jgi:hypothetical protein